MATSTTPKPKKLTGSQWRILLNALKDAFSYRELERLLKFEMDIDLSDIVFPGPMPDVLYEVISFTEARNRTLELVEAAQRNRPNLPLIFDFAQSVGVAPPTDNLERILSSQNVVFDIVAFRNQVAAIERQVCRVEMGGQPRGTGFLVAPNLLITNYHVLEDVIRAKGAGADKVTLRFDYKVLDDGTTINSGVIHRLVVGALDDWLIDSSPYSSADHQPEPKTSTPAVDELDYALLRLDSSPGEDRVGEPSLSDERGHLSLPALGTSHDFEANKVLFIVQHPKGQPLKITANIYRGHNQNDTRITYFNDTEPGSSGSPCFDANWQIVALHHSGDPDFSRPGQYNEGIPLQAVVSLLSKRGKLAGLGG